LGDRLTALGVNFNKVKLTKFFFQGIAQVLGFLPNTTYSSFLITAPNTVNLSPNETYFLTISNLPNSNQSSRSFTFSFFIYVNQTSGQILFLSSSEKDQSIQMGNTITTNHLNVELRNRNGTYVDTQGLPWSFTLELIN